MRRNTLGLSLCVLLGLGTPSFALDLHIAGNSVAVSLPSAGHSTLTVSGPDGFHREAFSNGGSVALQLGAGGKLADGIYNYEVTAATGERTPNPNQDQNNGRTAEPPVVYVGVTESGTFTVENGVIVQAPKAPAGAPGNSTGTSGDRDG